LDVKKSASISDIKDAFRQKALELHPDTSLKEITSQTEQQFLDVQEAYNVLTNFSRKQDYD
jgi:molecular chaperone DnaJ